MSNNHEQHELGHILPFSTYRNVLISLLVLTVLTVVVAKFIHFGSPAVSLVIAMIIASFKASIVAMYFMHLRYEHPITWLYALFPVILLLVLIAGVFIDNPFRFDPRG